MRAREGYVKSLAPLRRRVKFFFLVFFSLNICNQLPELELNQKEEKIDG